MGIHEYNIPDGYRQERIELEKYKLLKTASGEACYEMRRAWVAHFAGPLVEQALNSGWMPQVLEVGGGYGNAIRKLIESYSSYPEFTTQNITMTSLQSMLEHTDLIAAGVNVEPGIIIEDLPKEWSRRFNVVMTSAVLQWAKPNEAACSVAQVLKPNGVWVGIETNFGSAETAVKELVSYKFTSIGSGDHEAVRDIGIGYLFAMKKPE